MKHLTILLFSLLLTNLSYSQCLNGTYVIGPDIGDDYPTIDSAVNHLVVQGMCSAVNFTIKSGTYTNTQVVIPEIAGNTSANPLTIESVSGITSSTVLTRGTTNSASDNYTISIEGVKYLTLKNLTIQRASLLNNYATVVDISDTSSTLTFENLNISTPGYGYSNFYRNLIVSDAVVDTLKIKKTSFLSGQSAIYAWQGNFNNFQVDSCTFSNQYQYGITTTQSNDISISRCNFNLQSNSNSGFILNLSGASIDVAQNTFLHKVNGTSPAVSASGQTGSISSVNFSNNFITGVPGSPYQTKGVHFQNFDTVACYFNTIKTRGDNLNLSYNLSVDLRNNILDNQWNNKSLLLFSNTNVVSDYNCFNNPSEAPKVEYNGALYSVFSDYQSITGLDTHSYSHVPNYLNDYHLADIILNDAGTPISGITEDLEGELRAATPDIGADEFLPPAVELELLQFDNIEADMCPGLTPLFCSVTNLGMNTIDSILFTINVNGSFYSNHLWTGTLNSLDTLSIPFVDFDFVDLSSYQIELIIDSVNNQLDYNPSNNSLIYYNIDTRMQGVYTVGYQNGDFEYMYDALEELQAHKTCGTVTFEFEDAFHRFYSSATNPPLPFVLNGINEDSVIFRPQNPKVNDDYRAAVHILRMQTYDCSKLFFQDLVFHEARFDFTWSDSISFTGNYFKDDSTNNSYYVGTSAINVSYSEEISLLKNTFVHGTSSVDFSETTRIFIDSCKFKDVASQAIHASESDSLFITNSLFDLNATTTDECIFLGTNGYFEILNNHFFTRNAPALEVYLIPYSWFPEPPRLFANNSVTSNNALAIDWYGYKKLKMVHNNFLVQGDSPGSVVNFDFAASSQDDLYIEHNIFKNISGGTFYEGSLPTGGYINFNAYDTTGTVFHSSTQSFSSWASQSLDPNSVLSNLDYVNERNLHLLNYSTPLVGNNIIHIARDLDTRLRMSPPSIGAYELRIDSIEVELLTDGMPTGTCGDSPIYELYFTNTGIDTLYHGNFVCVINQSDTLDIGWTGALGYGDTSLVSFGILENEWEDGNNVTFYFSGSPHQHQTVFTNDTINYNYAGSPMSGHYMIGGSSADFFNLQTAIDALTNRGVCDSVFLDIQQDAIPFSLDLTSLNATNLFLFSSIDGLENHHLWVGSNTSTPLQQALNFVIDSCENITFENIGFYSNVYSNGVNWTASGTPNYQNNFGNGFCRMQLSNCDNIAVKSCVFEVGHSDAIGIMNNSHRILIDNNQFVDCGFTVSSLVTNDTVSHVTISNNHTEGIPYFDPTASNSVGAAINSSSPQNLQLYNIYFLPNIDDLVIRNNTNVSNGTYSLYIDNCQNDPNCRKYGLEISNNQFRGTCYLSEVHGKDSSRVKIFNNFFSGTSAIGFSNFSTLFVKGTYIDIFHNSIRTLSKPIYLERSGPPYTANFRMEKNLFLNPSHTYDIVPNLHSIVFDHCDNNAFAGSPPSVSGFETNSISYSPSVVSNYDFHLTGGAGPTSLNQALSTSYDIDYDFRGALSSYGADEAPSSDSIDGGIVNYVTIPSLCNDSIDLFLVLINQGINELYDFSIATNWDGNADTTYYSNSVNSLEIDTVFIGSFPVQGGNSYNVQADLFNVNNTIDANPSNNVLIENYDHLPNLNQIDTIVCDGNGILVDGVMQTMPGIYYDTLVSSYGCDSILEYQLTVLPDTLFDTIRVCFGEGAQIHGQFETAAGSYSASAINSLGCTYFLTTELVVLPEIDVTTTYNPSTITISVVQQPNVTYQWVSCATFSNMAYGTSHEFNPPYFGAYAVIVDNGICADTSDCFTYDAQSGLEEGRTDNFTVYPNPSHDQITIRSTSSNDYTFNIVDVTGRILFTSTFMNEKTISVSEFSSGLYYVNVNSEGRVNSVPFTKR